MSKAAKRDESVDVAEDMFAWRSEDQSEEYVEPSPEELDAALAEANAEIARAHQEIEEDRQNPVCAIGSDEIELWEAPAVPLALVSSPEEGEKPIKHVGGAALMSAEARQATPLSWEDRVRNLGLHEISEIVLCMQSFAVLYINSTSDLLLTPDSTIEQIETDATRRDWYYDKVVAYEWFFGPYYEGRLPRVALEEVAPLLSLHPNWIRQRMRREPPKPKQSYTDSPEAWGLLTPRVRAELYSNGVLLQPRHVMPDLVHKELFWNRGDPELEALLQARGGQKEWWKGCGRPKPGLRKSKQALEPAPAPAPAPASAPALVSEAVLFSRGTVFDRPRVVLNSVTREILSHAVVTDGISPPSCYAVDRSLAVFRTLDAGALEELARARVVIR